MSRDLVLAHIVMQSILYAIFKDLYLNFSFLFGGLISLANFHLMVQDCEGLRGSGTSSRMVGGYTLRIFLMAGVACLALSTQKFHPYALLGGLFTLQASLYGRQLFWLASTAMIKRNA